MLVIRNAHIEEAQLISDLILNVAHYFSPGQVGDVAAWFLDSVAPRAIGDYINDPGYNYLVAYAGQDLVGVIAVRDTTHIYHLFVAPEVHRQGVAARLWARARSDALRAGNNEGFFVRSSEYAVPVYLRFGFRVVGERSEKDGLVFVPMRLELVHGHSERDSLTD